MKGYQAMELFGQYIDLLPPDLQGNLKSVLKNQGHATKFDEHAGKYQRVLAFLGDNVIVKPSEREIPPDADSHLADPEVVNETTISINFDAKALVPALKKAITGAQKEIADKEAESRARDISRVSRNFAGTNEEIRMAAVRIFAEKLGVSEQLGLSEKSGMAKKHASRSSGKAGSIRS